MREKPNCLKCQRPHLGGKDGLCENCFREKKPRKRLKRLLCQCGKVAIVVVLATVLTPLEEAMEVEVPLCSACRKLEEELELEYPPTRKPGTHPANPVQVIVVKNLPRPRRPLSGKKF